MIREGLILRTGVQIGRDISAMEILNQYDAVCVAVGAGQPRDLAVEGRNLNGIHFAMDFLTSQNRINTVQVHTDQNNISAENRKVLVIGGGDTGSDCVGTSIRQRATSVTQIEILPKPPLSRTSENPWPFYAKILKTTTSHEEGCERIWNLSTLRFTGSENSVTGAEVEEVHRIYGQVHYESGSRKSQDNRG
jgi:glutamate synthase (NADPH/NADH) small chain